MGVKGDLLEGRSVDGATANRVDMFFDACEVLGFDDDTSGMRIRIECGFVEVCKKKCRVESAGVGRRSSNGGRGRLVGFRWWSGLVF